MNLQPGDFLLVRTDHFVSKLIRIGQRSYGAEYAQWNHVALYVGGDTIVEALTGGVVRSSLDKYPASSVRRVPMRSVRVSWDHEADRHMRENAASFALSCVHESYGWMTIAAIALKTLTKGRWNFGVQGTSICSGLVARSLERMGHNFNPDDPSELTPAYLAKMFT